MSELHSVTTVDAIEPGTGRIFEIGVRQVAIFHVDGEFFALENTCCHRGGPLGDGPVGDGEVTCPWHGWRFDLETGACLNSPGDRVRCYEVQVEDGVVRVRI